MDATGTKTTSRLATAGSLRLLAHPGAGLTPVPHPFLADPFRPFFLLGWIISLIGLAMWPLFFLEWLTIPPGRTHAFLMIQGFLGAFATGFLWTALPRMLETPGPGKAWLGGGLLLIAGNSLLHLTGFHFGAHLLFLGLLGLLAAFTFNRFPARRDLPPPSFILVATGMATGAVGTILVAAGEAGWTTGATPAFGRLLLTEMFLLLLVLGVSAFLAPRFIGERSRQNLPESRTPSTAWKRQALLAGSVAAVILAGAGWQSAGFVRTGALTVALPVTGYLLWQVPVWRRSTRHTWMADALRLALLCCVAAPWMRLVFPEARLESAHLLLMGGFGLLTLVISSRVVFGHSGHDHLFQKRLPSLGVMAGLCALALFFRLAGGFGLGPWMPMLAVSVALLLAAHLLWGWIVLPKLVQPRPDPATTEPPVISDSGTRDPFAHLRISPVVLSSTQRPR